MLAVERELTFGNTVAETTDDPGEIRLRRIDDILDVVVAHDDVGPLPIAVGNHDSYERTTIVCDCYFVTFTISQNKEVCLLAVHSGLKVLTLQTAYIWCFFRVCHMKVSLVDIL